MFEFCSVKIQKSFAPKIYGQYLNKECHCEHCPLNPKVWPFERNLNTVFSIFQANNQKIPFNSIDTFRRHTHTSFQTKLRLFFCMCVAMQMWLLCVLEFVVRFSPYILVHKSTNRVMNIFVQCFRSQNVNAQNIFYWCYI